jgi:hypothetical protein
MSDKIFDEKLKELMEMPEYENINAFVEYKIDNEEDYFTTEDLQSLSRVYDFAIRKISNAMPPQQLVKNIKNELISYGLKFIPREPTKHIRGALSSAHGSSPYAGFGGGGSGMSSGGIGMGGGPGVAGGKYSWDSKNTEKNLPMGSRRKYNK